MKEEFQDKLKALEEELYSKEEGVEKQVERRSVKTIFPKEMQHAPSASWVQNKEEARAPLISPRRILKFFFWGFALFIVVTGTTLGFLYLGKRGDEVELLVGGRDRVEAGELVTVPVTIKNITRVPLKEVEVVILLPERTILKEGNAEHYAPSRIVEKFDTITPQEEKKIELALRFFGREGEDRLIDVTVLYRPENLRAKFSAHATQLFTITHVPLAVFWELPETVTQNQELEVRVRYISNARAPVDNLSLRLQYPPGFVLKSTDPATLKGTPEWKVGTLEPGASGTVLLRGTISGEEGEVKAFRGELGVYEEATKTWLSYSESNGEFLIAQAPLSVRGFLAGTRDHIVNPGEKLVFSLQYKNNTTATLKNVTLRAFLDELFALPSGTFPDKGSSPRILLFPSLVIEQGGVFEAGSRAIIWGPGGLGALREVAPGTSGEVQFQIDTRPRPLMKSSQDKNIMVRLRSSIDAANIPQDFAGAKVGSEDAAQFKVKTVVLFGGKAAYRASPIVNSGPLPPRVGQKTTYAIVWEIRNFTSTLENVEIHAPVPPNIKWENVISPRDAKITFDPASSEIVWRVGEVRAGTGVVVPALVGAAQISLIPTEADIGNTPRLVAESRLTGKDSFTGQEISEGFGSFTTALRDDPGTVRSQWNVVQ